MKKVLFAFLFSMALAFVANASNALHPKANQFSKKKINKKINFFIDFCSYSSYSNGGWSYSGYFCGCDLQTWCEMMDQKMSVIDAMAAIDKILGDG